LRQIGSKDLPDLSHLLLLKFIEALGLEIALTPPGMSMGQGISF
jgi:hypothetical protein